MWRLILFVMFIAQAKCLDFSNDWAVYIPGGESDVDADQVALEHGFRNLGQVR